MAYVVEQLLCRGDARCAGTFHEPLRLVKGRGVLARELEQPGRLGLEPRDGREVTGMVGGVGAERGALRQPMTAHHEIVAVLLPALALMPGMTLSRSFKNSSVWLCTGAGYSLGMPGPPCHSWQFSGCASDPNCIRLPRSPPAKSVSPP